MSSGASLETHNSWSLTSLPPNPQAPTWVETLRITWLRLGRSSRHESSLSKGLAVLDSRKLGLEAVQGNPGRHAGVGAETRHTTADPPIKTARMLAALDDGWYREAHGTA